MISSKNKPVETKIKSYVSKHMISFAMPGHKGNRGINRTLKKNVFRYDVTELEWTDNLHYPSSAIQNAQKEAAKAFGAKQTYFLVNGSTVGVYAMIAAVCSPGDKILLDRSCHISAINACAMLGVTPVYIKQNILDVFSVPSGININDVIYELDRNSDVKAILITSPSYYGICPDVGTIAKIAHGRNIPLLVDEAHGAHFVAEPGCFPPTALLKGADLCVQSGHKTLNAMTQTAFLHTRSDIVDKDKLEAVLKMLQSSSPSFPFVISLDGARSDINSRRWKSTYNMCVDLKKAVTETTKIQCITSILNSTNNIDSVDETRMVFNFSAYKTNGFEVSKILREKYRIDVEMSDLFNVVCIATPNNNIIEYIILKHALCKIASELEESGQEPSFPPLPVLECEMSPQKAFYAKGKTVNINDSIGCVSKTNIASYPPGVAIICIGEKITAKAVEYVSALDAMGADIIGFKGAKQIEVVAENVSAD